MSQVKALFKKEIMESVRNFKLIALIVVFMIFGVISPLTAILLPEIMETFIEEDGFYFEMPEVQALDSYVQFFSNVNQMGLVVLVIVLGGILTNEMSRNTLINLVTKGLKRYKVIVVKSIYACLMWTAAYVSGAVITYLYTIYYWEGTVPNIILAFSSTWLFGIFLISVIMFASSIFKSSYVGVLLTVLLSVVMMIMISIHPVLQEYMPQYLLGASTEILSGEMTAGDVVSSIIVTIVTSMLMFILSIIIFNKAAI